MDQFYIILDGSNIAFYKRTHNKKAKYSNLKTAIEFLKKLEEKYSIKWEIIVDASLRHRIDEKDKLEFDIKTGKINQCPNKAEADGFILSFFKRHPERTIIVSNDNFEDHSISNLTICKFVIMFDELITDPDLEELLKSKIKSLKEGKAKVDV